MKSLSRVRLFATPWTVAFSIHGIFQARILEWIAISFSRRSSWPRLPHCRQMLYHLSHQRRRNGVTLIVNKRVWNAVLGCNLKNDRMISVRFQGKLFSITVIQVYAPTTDADEAEVERFYEDLTRPSRNNTPPQKKNKKKMSFHHRGLECKSRKSRDTWSNRQTWPWSTEWSRGKANRVLPRECTDHSKHSLSTTQEKTLHMDITRWPIPKSDWFFFLKMEKLCTVCKNKTRSWLWLRSWTPYFKILWYTIVRIIIRIFTSTVCQAPL